VDELFRRTVIDAAVAGATVDVPEVLVNRQIGEVLHNISHQLPEGVSLEQYLQATGRPLDQVVSELRPDAEMAVRRELVVEAVAEAEGIEVADEDVEAQVRSDAEASGRDPHQLLADLRERGGFETLRHDLRLRRAVDRLVESAVPISIEQAKAREKLWTPGTQEAEAETPKLWTPDEARRAGSARAGREGPSDPGPPITP
jgi:trigger factor